MGRLDISHLVRERAKNTQVSYEEIVHSPEFATYVQALATGMTQQYSRSPQVHIKLGQPSDTPGCTNGNMIMINPNSHLIDKGYDTQGKLKVCIGILLHEIAHVVFCDFENDAKCLDALNNGEIPVSVPKGDPQDVQAMIDMIKSPVYRVFFQKLYHDLANIIDDQHDETALINAYSGFNTGNTSLAESGLMFTRDCLYRSSQSLDADVQCGASELRLLISMVFQYIRFGQFLIRDEGYMSTIMPPFDDIKRECDAAVHTDLAEERYRHINQIVLAMMPYILQQKQDAQNQQPDQTQPQEGQGDQSSSQAGQSSGDSQSSGDNSASSDSGSSSQGSSGSQSSGESSSESQKPDLDSLLDALAKAEQSVNSAPAPTNCANSKKANEKRNSAQQSQRSDSADSSTQDGKGQSGDEQADARATEKSAAGQGANEGKEDNDEAAQQQQSGQDGKEKSQDGSDSSQTGDNEQDPQSTPGQNGKKGEKPQDNSQSGQFESGDDARDALNDALAQLVQKLATKKAEDQVANELAEADAQAIDVNNLGAENKRRRFIYSTAEAATDADEKKYGKILKEVKSYSDRLQRLLRQELEESRKGALLKHRQFGRGFDPRDAYRPDSRYYTTKKVPNDIPEMAISILIDKSGSTALDGRLESAIKTAVLLQDFCRGLNIPVMVAGHDVSAYPDAVEFTTYINFDEVSPRTRAKVVKMTPGGCNRDGMALWAAVQLLAKRPEPIRLQFIISDGRPNDGNYGVGAAAKDIKEIMKFNKKNHIELFAAAIGDDKDLIQALYGDSFLDISNLATFPKVITNIVKRKIQSYL